MASTSNVRWQGLTQPYFETVEHNNRPLVGPIRAFAQDQDGFIWIVSDNDLWRWDAYELLKVELPQQADNANLTADVQTIKSAPDGTVWVGTTNGLYRIHDNKTSLSRVTTSGYTSLSVEFIAFNYSEDNKNIYLGNEYHIYEYSPALGSLRVLPLIGSASNRVHALHVSPDNFLWVGSNQGLLYKNLLATNKQPLKFFQGVTANTRISALFSGNDQRLWIGTAKQGVFTIDKNHRINRVALPANSMQVPWVYDITEVRSGLMWFGTFGDGIIEYDEKNNRFKSIQQQRLLKSNLLDNDIWTLFRDQRGLIWVGSRLGVNIYNAPQTAFQQIPGGDSRLGLSDALIYSTLAMPDQTLWLGTGKQGIEIIQPYSAKVRHLKAGSIVGNTRIPENSIDSLSLINNEVLAGSNWNALRLNKEGTFARPLVLNGRPVDEYSGAFAWFGNQLWVGGVDGLWRVPNQANRKSVNIFGSLRGDQRVNHLLADGNCLWVGTWTGVKRVFYDASAAGGIRIENLNNTALKQQYINVIGKDARQRIWIGTYSAGLFFNTEDGIKQNKAWQNLSEKDGLPSNNVTNLQVDNNNNIWIGSAHGIAFIDNKSLAITAIHPEQGASAAPYESGTRTALGEIVFGGGYGLTIINPELWRSEQFKPNLVISRIDSNAKNTLEIQTAQNRFGVFQNKLVVPPNTSRLAFDFSALDFVSARQLHYRFRLIGFDDTWTETKSKQRTATFTSLTPGNYELQVQYSFDGRKWQDNDLSLNIELKPAWHQHFLFKLLLATLTIIFGFAVMRWRDRRYKLQQHLLEQRVLERTTELESVNLILKKQSATIEHASLTDPLTGLRNRRFLTQHIESDAQIALRRYLKPEGTQDIEAEQADLLFYIIDIDHFKRVNDLWGHAAGDEVLIEMRRRLLSVFRGADYVVRWGGEEFLAVTRGSSRAHANEMAERIRDSIIGQAFQISKSQFIDITCSIGYAAYPFFMDAPEALSWNETFALADAALYSAKNSGRNTWCGYDASGHPANDLLVSAAHEVPINTGALSSLQVYRLTPET